MGQLVSGYGAVRHSSFGVGGCEGHWTGEGDEAGGVIGRGNWLGSVVATDAGLRSLGRWSDLSLSMLRSRPGKCLSW